MHIVGAQGVKMALDTSIQAAEFPTVCSHVNSCLITSEPISFPKIGQSDENTIGTTFCMTSAQTVIQVEESPHHQGEAILEGSSGQHAHMGWPGSTQVLLLSSMGAGGMGRS